MSFVRVVAALFAALVCSSAAAAAPLSAYGKLPTIEEVAVSPSGHALALIVTNGEERVLVVQDLATEQVLLRATAGNLKVRGIDWAGDRHLLIVTSVTAAPLYLSGGRGEWFMGFLFDLETKKAQQLLRNIGKVVGMNTLAGMPQVRMVGGKPVVFMEGVVFVESRGRISLFRQDVGSSSSRLLETGAEDTRDWILGTDGSVLAQELYDDRTGRWSLRFSNGPGWREAMVSQSPYDPPGALGLGRDGKSVVVVKSDEDGRVSWQETGPEGPRGEAIVAYDNQSPIYDPLDGRLMGYGVMVGDELRYTFFDANDARVWRAVTAAYPNEAVRLVSWSRDRKKIVVLADSPTDGPAYAIVDVDARRAKWIGAQYSGLGPNDISPQQKIRYKAADGLELTGYLTLPRGKPAKDLPLVVFPHGGPASRDTPGFDWWAQGMASRGYAVLQVNFRGSDGLGADLLEAGYGQWGRKMQTDLSDGVRHLASQGIIDPKRVCIVGGSYGGYAALAGATIDRGVYRCAVSVAGVSDLKRQVSYSRNRGGRSTYRYWTRFMGAEDLGDAVLTAYSPAAQAAKAEAPVLLIHGKDDTVVPLEQSRVMAEALKKAGKPYELIVQPGADHWLSRGDTRLQTLEATVAFLEKHNPPN